MIKNKINKLSILSLLFLLASCSTINNSSSTSNSSISNSTSSISNSSSSNDNSSSSSTSTKDECTVRVRTIKIDGEYSEFNTTREIEVSKGELLSLEDSYKTETEKDISYTDSNGVEQKLKTKVEATSAIYCKLKDGKTEQDVLDYLKEFSHQDEDINILINIFFDEIGNSQKIYEDTLIYFFYQNEETSYQVVFLNDDGTVLQDPLYVKANDHPTYTKAKPTKANSDTDTYTFVGWAVTTDTSTVIPSISDLTEYDVESCAIFKAIFSSSPIVQSYTVTLKNYVNNQLKSYNSGKVNEGSYWTQSCTPSKEYTYNTDADGLESRNTYTFKYWIKLLNGKTEADLNSLSDGDYEIFDLPNTAITEDITLYGIFDVVTSYAVYFYNYDGEELFHSTYTNSIKYTNDTPSKDPTDEYFYVFAGWKDKDGTIIDLKTEVPNRNYKLYAYFTTQYYPKISIVDQNNDIIYTKYANLDSNVISKDKLEKEMQANYWDDEENKEVHYFTLGNDIPTTETTITEDTTYHATVTTISYEKNGIWPQTKVTDTELQGKINNATSTYTLGSSTYYVVDNKYYSKDGYRKVEPIKWIILSGDFNSGATLISEKVLTKRAYFDYVAAGFDESYTTTGKGGSRLIDGNTVYHNNYKYSDIRAWLNGDFINNTFKDDTLLQTTEIDNSKNAFKTSNSTVSSDYDNIVCENTNDKVWLLSYRELFCIAQDTTFTPYDYFGAYDQNDTGSLSKRIAYDVDGVASVWYLRAPSHFTYLSTNCEYNVNGVGTNGMTQSSDCKSAVGIRPVVQFKF